MRKETQHKPDYSSKNWDDLTTEEQEDFLKNFRNDILEFKNYSSIVTKWLDRTISDYDIKIEKNRYKIEQREKDKSLSKLFQLNESLVLKVSGDGYKLTEYIYKYGDPIPSSTTVINISGAEGNSLIRYFESKSSENELREIRDRINATSFYKNGIKIKEIYDQIISYIF